MKLIYLISLLLLFGCAYPKKTSQFEFEKAIPNKAIIYIYRLPTSVHSLNPDVPKFYVGDRTIGKLLIGGYYSIQVEPARVDITYKTPLFGIYPPWKSGRLQVDAYATKPVFIKFEVAFGMGSSTRFIQVPIEVGKREISKTVLLKN